MKLTHYISITLVYTLSVFSGFTQDYFSEGLKSYNKKNYAKSIESFSKVLNNDSTNVSAWFNMGLANVELKRFGEAVFCFEKVLTFQPNDNVAKDKVESVFFELHPDKVWQPRIGEIKSGLFSVSANTWAYISVFFSFLFFTSLVIYKKAKQVSLKNSLITLSIFMFALVALTLYIANGTNNYHQNNVYGIVTQKKIPTYNKEKKPDNIRLEAGIRLKKIKTIDAHFVTVTSSNGNKYIIRYKDLSWL